MAKKSPSKFAKSLSLEEIINIDARELVNMPETDVRYLVGRVAKRVNSRLKKIESISYGRLTPAYSNFIEGEYTDRVRLSPEQSKLLKKKSKAVHHNLVGRGIKVTRNINKKGRTARMSLKGVGIEDVRRTFYKARDFLKSRTSTVEGIEEINRELSKRMGIEDLNPRSTKKYWKIYHELQRQYPKAEDTMASQQLQRMVMDYYLQYNKTTTASGKTRYLKASEIARRIGEGQNMVSKYEKRQQERQRSTTKIAKFHFRNDEE